MGLWFRTAVSYMIVTISAVLLVEALLIGVYAPRVISDKPTEQNVEQDASADAGGLAVKLSAQISADHRAGVATGATAAAGITFAGHLKSRPGPCAAAAKADPLYLVLGTDGTVLDSSLPDCLPAHRRAPPLPGDGVPARGASGVGTGAGGYRVAWARAPIVWTPPPGVRDVPVGGSAALLGRPGARQVASLYEQRSVTTAGRGTTLGDVRPLIVPGLVVLAAAVPVGLLFGLVSMRRPVRRLRRLAATTQALADGDLDKRITVTGRDELSQLEGDVNRMAERLAASMAAERSLAGAQARTAERARIARDLHDSVSQDLFSLRMLAGGLARALPADSPLRRQLGQMDTTAASAIREMQAMLLQLRPAALADGALATALDNLARTYRDRVGIAVHTELAAVSLPPEVEHALLRIAQEAFANAVRHGDPTQLNLTLSGQVLRIRDNGRGFDPDEPATGMGLTLMRERAAEVGATLTVTSTPGRGSTVEVRLP